MQFFLFFFFKFSSWWVFTVLVKERTELILIMIFENLFRRGICFLSRQSPEKSREMSPFCKSGVDLGLRRIFTVSFWMPVRFLAFKLSHFIQAKNVEIPTKTEFYEDCHTSPLDLRAGSVPVCPGKGMMFFWAPFGPRSWKGYSFLTEN